MIIEQLNKMSERPAHDLFFSCCSSNRWADAMVKARPFASLQDLLDKASSLWGQASESDLLAAFSGHPKIGDLHALRNKYASVEQGQIRQADESVLIELKELNETYESRFGFIFIVCASGKSAGEMCGILKSRIDNTRAQELANGADEQEKITAIRLTKLFSPL